MTSSWNISPGALHTVVRSLVNSPSRRESTLHHLPNFFAITDDTLNFGLAHIQNRHATPVSCCLVTSTHCSWFNSLCLQLALITCYIKDSSRDNCDIWHICSDIYKPRNILGAVRLVDLLNNIPHYWLLRSAESKLFSHKKILFDTPTAEQWANTHKTMPLILVFPGNLTSPRISGNYVNAFVWLVKYLCGRI